MNKSPQLSSKLTVTQRQTLSLIGDTLLPLLERDVSLAEPLRRLQAAQNGTAELLAGLVQRSVTEEFGPPLAPLISRLESRLFNGLLVGNEKPLSEMSLAERTELLVRWRDHRWQRLREAFLAFKRTALYACYANPAPAKRNELWAALNYHPAAPTGPRGEGESLTVLSGSELSSPQALEADVVVIGSGAGGGATAAVLAMRGLSVLVLEQGPFVRREELGQSEGWGNRKLMSKSAGTLTPEGLPIILAGTGLGGGTVVNWMSCLEPPAEILDQWANEFGLECARDGELLSACRSAAERLAVSMSPTDVNAQNELLRRGCETLGWSYRQIPRNAPGCDQCDLCGFGCRGGHKIDGRRSFLSDACRQGARILAGTRAVKLLDQGPGEIHVEALQRVAAQEPRLLKLRARAVVVAAGAIQTPALLLRSGLSHPALGRHLHLHPTAMVTGRFAHPIRPWQGPPQSIVCEEFSHLSADGFGVRIETAPLHPGFAAMALPWESGGQHKALMGQLAQLANLIVLTRDRDGGQVGCDRQGNAQVRYQLSAADRANLLEGAVQALKCLYAAGAESLWGPFQIPILFSRRSETSLESFLQSVAGAADSNIHLGLYSAHQMSTCRMSREAEAGVTDLDGRVRGTNQVYVADTSLFPTASGVNPMLTVLGLARLVAERLADTLTVRNG